MGLHMSKFYSGDKKNAAYNNVRGIMDSSHKASKPFLFLSIGLFLNLFDTPLFIFFIDQNPAVQSDDKPCHQRQSSYYNVNEWNTHLYLL